MNLQSSSRVNNGIKLFGLWYGKKPTLKVKYWIYPSIMHASFYLWSCGSGGAYLGPQGRTKATPWISCQSVTGPYVEKQPTQTLLALKCNWLGWHLQNPGVRVSKTSFGNLYTQHHDLQVLKVLADVSLTFEINAYLCWYIFHMNSLTCRRRQQWRLKISSHSFMSNRKPHVKHLGHHIHNQASKIR